MEAKNAELKHAHGLARADSVGLSAVRLQTFLTAFTANVKRIVRLSATILA
ncbi:MAG: transposase [Oscillospiraceae bacterium]|nr:transposase [Oscillospiraceae bacterium]